MNVQVVGRFYDRIAGLYDLLFDQVFREGRREAMRAMEPKWGDRILEVGVGTGLNLPLYPTGVQVTGIDLSMPMLEEARQRASKSRSADPVQLLRMDAMRLSFPDNTFDAVYAPYVVSVVPHPERVVAEMARVCKPGGSVVIVNHFSSKHRVGRWFERRLSPLTHHVGFRLDLPLDSVLGAPGLHMIEVRPVNMMNLWRLLVFKKGLNGHAVA